MLANFCPPEIWKGRNKSDMKIEFPNGSMLYFMGADNPDSLRGPNPDGVVMDEYGDMKGEVWSAIVQPIMMANPRSWCWFMGTPKGQNDFKQKYDYAKRGEDSNWWYSHLTASQSDIIDKDSLVEAKKTTTQAFFDQEYECKFLESAGQYFRRIRENIHTTNDFPLSHRYQMGADLAKYNDWTVITLVDLNTLKVMPQERFNQIDWNLQKARIEATYFRWNPKRGIIDSTGIGDPVVEDLMRKCSRIEGFKFTETSRRQILDNLSILLEQDRIKIPNDDGLITELEAFRFELNENGKVKVAVPSGYTDDRVMSMALALKDVEYKIPLSGDKHTNEIFNRYELL